MKLIQQPGKKKLLVSKPNLSALTQQILFAFYMLFVQNSSSFLFLGKPGSKANT